MRNVGQAWLLADEIVYACHSGNSRSAQIVASDQETAAFFGSAIAIYGMRIIVGAPQASVGGVYGVGAAYRFEFNVGADRWEQLER